MPGESGAVCADTGSSAILLHVDYAQRHLRLGWWSLFIFATAGLVLESLHGFKIRAYLDVSNGACQKFCVWGIT